MIKGILKGENLKRVFFAFLKENNAFYNYLNYPQAKDLWDLGKTESLSQGAFNSTLTSSVVNTTFDLRSLKYFLRILMLPFISAFSTVPSEALYKPL